MAKKRSHSHRKIRKGGSIGSKLKSFGKKALSYVLPSVLGGAALAVGGKYAADKINDYDFNNNYDDFTSNFHKRHTRQLAMGINHPKQGGSIKSVYNKAKKYILPALGTVGSAVIGAYADKSLGSKPVLDFSTFKTDISHLHPATSFIDKIVQEQNGGKVMKPKRYRGGGIRVKRLHNSRR